MTGKILNNLMSINITEFPHAKLHQHLEAQLSYIQKGVLKVIVNQKVYIIPSGFIIYIPSNITHGIEARHNIESVLLHFSPCTKYICPKEICIIKSNELIKQLIFKIDQNIKETHLVYSQALFQAINEEDTFIDYTLYFPNHPLLRDIITFIDRHLDSPLPIEAIAKKANMSSRHLSRIFKTETGLSFSYWLQQYKMLYALVLLPHHKSTSIVARKLGYDSDSAFINTFKKMTLGKSPSFFYKR